MRIVTKTLNIVVIVALIAIAGLFFATMFPVPFAKDVEIKIVKSGSMEPAIQTGALIVVAPAASYGVGDVITFGEDTKTQIPTTHRVLAVREENGEKIYTTKGDANEEQDSGFVRESEIIGKVYFNLPYVGYVLDFARQPWGFALLIGLPALIIIFDEFANIFGEVRRLRRNRIPHQNSASEGPRKKSSSLWSMFSKKSSGLLSARQTGPQARLFSQTSTRSTRSSAPRFFEDIRVVYTRRRISHDMFVRSKPTIMFFVAFVLTGSVFMSSIGGTLSFFSDTETSTANIFRAGEWFTADPADIVLNEFLPNPDTSANGMNLGMDSDNMPLGEWIELYNKGPVEQDLFGWYMTDASGGVGNTHAVITGTTTNTGGTIIPAGGFLVVYMNKPSLNNTGDEIYLYTPDDVQTDFYSYEVPSDFCEFENTPGNPNAGDGSGTPGNGQSGDCSDNQVAENKSYARIPDGVGAWVDPVPTPGTPNMLDEESAEALSEHSTNEPVTNGGGGGSDKEKKEKEVEVSEPTIVVEEVTEPAAQAEVTPEVEVSDEPLVVEETPVEEDPIAEETPVEESPVEEEVQENNETATETPQD